MTESTSVVVYEARNLVVDERIVSGILMPWNETTYLAGDPRGERFLPGAFTRSVKAKGERLKLFRGTSREHDQTVAIGRVKAMDPRHPDGLWGEWRIAQTPAGDAALAEVAEGLLDAFSVGFRAVRAGRGSDGAREVAEAELLEVNLLPLGAYDGARVLETRAPVVRMTPDELDRWLDEHPTPDVDRTPLPDLRYRGSGRQA